jgi:carboxymethylenebutenolidase
MNRINVGWAFGPLMHLTGFDYHHPSAEDSWRRIFAFFDEHLGAGGEGQGGGAEQPQVTADQVG